MNSSWPVGVTTIEDLIRYAKILFPNGTKETVDAHGRDDIIQVNSKRVAEAHGRDEIMQVTSKRARVFDTLQTTPNKYHRNDCMAFHQDLSTKPAMQQTALYYQFPGGAIIMSGHFNLNFCHGVPAVDS